MSVKNFVAKMEQNNEGGDVNRSQRTLIYWTTWETHFKDRGVS